EGKGVWEDGGCSTDNERPSGGVEVAAGEVQGARVALPGPESRAGITGATGSVGVESMPVETLERQILAHLDRALRQAEEGAAQGSGGDRGHGGG
ncbi:unnamed protein product, partial [Discosporangium mesarthrocarpum]